MTLDEAEKRIEKLENECRQYRNAILHFYNYENAAKVELKLDTTKRDLGGHAHKCRICGAEGIFKTYLVREMMQGTREEFEYFECGECGCLQISEVPEDIGKYYGENYYSFSLKEDPYRQYSVPVSRMDKILDVGCGSGVWLVSLADNGFGNLYGCDPFLERDIHYGERVHIRSCAIHDIEGDGSFDRIRMSDSFEHMTDPEEALISAKRLLKADGVLEIMIPTYPNIAFDIFGTHWYQLDAPRHITLHSVRSMEYLADKVGLKIAQIKYTSNNGQFIRSFFYQRGITFNEITTELIDRFFSSDDIKKLDLQSEENNEKGHGDHMTVFMVHDN